MAVQGDLHAADQGHAAPWWNVSLPEVRIRAMLARCIGVNRGKVSTVRWISPASRFVRSFWANTDSFALAGASAFLIVRPLRVRRDSVSAESLDALRPDVAEEAPRIDNCTRFDATL